MKFLFDLFPVILFFGAFKYAETHVDTAIALTTSVLGFFGLSGVITADQAPILLATVATIIGALGQVVWVLAHRRKVDTMLWISLGLIVVLGGLTLVLRDETFIKWKPTALYWLFAASFFLSATVLKKNLIKAMLEAQMSLPEPVWSRLNLSWVGFFLVMGGLNLFVAFNFPTPVWVNYKLFGGTGLMILFVIAQAMYLSKHAEEKADVVRPDR